MKLLAALLLLGSISAHAAAPDEVCSGAIQLLIPTSGCRLGTAVVAVEPVAGASYSWSLDGGSFLSGSGTERITIALGGGDTAKVGVAVSTPGCTRNGAGVIALRDSFAVTSLSAGSGNTGQLRTISWSYNNGSPAVQTLTGTDFPAPVSLPPDARTYTYVVTTEGDKTVALEAHAVAAPPATGRQRAAGRGTSAVSDCSSTRAEAKYHVDCRKPEVSISAPAVTNDQSSFTAHVDLDAGQTAQWTITNATPATATGESVVVKPTGPSPIDLTVVVKNGSCAATAAKRVTVDPTVTCDNPSAVVWVYRNDCSGTVVQARLTGKPPFRGTWNDGAAFQTNDFAVDRPVSAAGKFSVTTLSDALCAGEPSNTISVTPRIVSATLAPVNGTCAGTSQVMATFTGTPPFTGTWSDGTTFTTSANTIVRPVTAGGTVSLQFKDAECDWKSSNSVDFRDPGSVVVSLDPATLSSCFPLNTYVRVVADVIGGIPPYSVTWSDGLTQTTGSGTTSSRFTRTVYSQSPSTTIGVVSGHDFLCSLKTGPGSSLTIKAAPTASISISGSLCRGQTSYATLPSNQPSGSSIFWSIQNGSIIAGQGTTRLTFTGGTEGTGTVVSCDITTPLGCVAHGQSVVNFYRLPAAPQPALSPGTTVHPGTPVTIAWAIDSMTSSTKVEATGTLQPTGLTCKNNLCSATYTPPAVGSVILTVHAYGFCGDRSDGSATLSVVP